MIEPADRAQDRCPPIGRAYNTITPCRPIGTPGVNRLPSLSYTLYRKMLPVSRAVNERSSLLGRRPKKLLKNRKLCSLYARNNSILFPWYAFRRSVRQKLAVQNPRSPRCRAPSIRYNPTLLIQGQFGIDRDLVRTFSGQVVVRAVRKQSRDMSTKERWILFDLINYRTAAQLLVLLVS
jgi:hypothetical protein